MLLNPLFQRSIIPSIVFSEVRHDCHGLRNSMSVGFFSISPLKFVASATSGLIS